jgi:hypothetical protein
MFISYISGGKFDKDICCEIGEVQIYGAIKCDSKIQSLAHH